MLSHTRERTGYNRRVQLASDQMMWMWRSLLCVSLVCGLALDSNTIRSSKEATLQSSEQLNGSHGDRAGQAMRWRTNSKGQASSPCDAADCSTPMRGGCSNRAQKRPSSEDRQRERETQRYRDTDSFNRTKAPEMSTCVRSRDCGAGLCCARYLTGKRCQRIPGEGEACLLQGSTKLKRNLGRCSCNTGLSCTPVGRAESSKNKGQGVCQPRLRQGQRKTRHSGKKRRTAERSC